MIYFFTYTLCFSFHSTFPINSVLENILLLSFVILLLLDTVYGFNLILLKIPQSSKCLMLENQYNFQLSLLSYINFETFGFVGNFL